MTDSGPTIIEPTPRQTAGGLLFGIGALGLLGRPFAISGPSARLYDVVAFVAVGVGLLMMLRGTRRRFAPRAPSTWTQAATEAAKVALGVSVLVALGHALRGEPQAWRSGLTVAGTVFVVKTLIDRFPIRPIQDRDPLQ